MAAFLPGFRLGPVGWETSMSSCLAERLLRVERDGCLAAAAAFERVAGGIGERDGIE